MDESLKELAQSGTNTNRRDDWDARLYEFLESQRDRRFAWGRHDCALFVCNAIIQMIGRDPGREFRGRYASEKGAYAALSRCVAGYMVVKVKCDESAADFPETMPLLEAVAIHLAAKEGFAEIPPANAQRGDAVLVKDPISSRLALGIIGFLGLPVCAAKRGFHTLGSTAILRAWRV